MSEVQVEQTVATPAQVAQTPAGGTAEAQPAEVKEPVKPPRTFSQEEVDAAIQKRLERAQRKHERETEELRQIALNGTPKPKDEPIADANARPKRESFADYELYVEALADWKADQRISTYEKTRVENEKKAQTERETRTVVQTHKEREAKAQEKYPDYAEKVYAENLPITEHMAQAIQLSDNGPDIAYYLGDHPAEAARIAKLHPILQAQEIGRIVEKNFSAGAPNVAQKTVAPSKAPDPISPVGGGKTTIADDELTGKETPEEWRRKRDRQEQKRRTGR